MKAQTISLQLYTLKDEMAADLEKTIERIAQMGFTTVELHRPTENTERKKAALHGAGLASPTAHAGLLSASSEEQRKIFTAVAEMGAKVVIDPRRDREYWQTTEDVEKIASGLNNAAALAKEFGLRVGYHTHDHEIEIEFDGKPAIEFLAPLLDPTIEFQIDIWWGTLGGKDLAPIVRRLGSRVRSLHIKDGVKGDAFKQTPVGEGDVDVDGLLEVAANSELAIIEFDGRRLPSERFEAIRKSRVYLAERGFKG